MGDICSRIHEDFKDYEYDCERGKFKSVGFGGDFYKHWQRVVKPTLKAYKEGRNKLRKFYGSK
jgi:hypothetical protein